MASFPLEILGASVHILLIPFHVKTVRAVEFPCLPAEASNTVLTAECFVDEALIALHLQEVLLVDLYLLFAVVKLLLDFGSAAFLVDQRANLFYASFEHEFLADSQETFVNEINLRLERLSVGFILQVLVESVESHVQTFDLCYGGLLLYHLLCFCSHGYNLVSALLNFIVYVVQFLLEVVVALF